MIKKRDTDRYILSTFPILWVPMTEDHHSDGAVFLSSDGRGYNCTVTGALPTLRGRKFDGSDDIITIASTSDFTLGTSDFTFEFWVMVTSLVDSAVIMATTNSKKNVVLSGTAGAIKISIEGASDWTSNAGLIDANAWIHLVITKEGTRGIIYKNGGMFQTDATAFSSANNTTTEALSFGYIA